MNGDSRSRCTAASPERDDSDFMKKVSVTMVELGTPEPFFHANRGRQREKTAAHCDGVEARSRSDTTHAFSVTKMAGDTDTLARSRLDLLTRYG